jgi:hypothetical protein
MGPFPRRLSAYWGQKFLDTDVPVERGSLSSEINRAIISRIIKQQVHEEPK